MCNTVTFEQIAHWLIHHICPDANLYISNGFEQLRFHWPHKYYSNSVSYEDVQKINIPQVHKTMLCLHFGLKPQITAQENTLYRRKKDFTVFIAISKHIALCDDGTPMLINVFTGCPLNINNSFGQDGPDGFEKVTIKTPSYECEQSNENIKVSFERVFKWLQQQNCDEAKNYMDNAFEFLRLNWPKWNSSTGKPGSIDYDDIQTVRIPRKHKDIICQHFGLKSRILKPEFGKHYRCKTNDSIFVALNNMNANTVCDDGTPVLININDGSCLSMRTSFTSLGPSLFEEINVLALFALAVEKE